MLFDVKITVEVELHEKAFTDEFMEEFRSYISPYYTLQDHAGNIAQLVAREIMGEVDSVRGKDQFVEGYGKIGKYVETARIVLSETEAI